MLVAFYKGRSRLFNRLVSWWTRSEYSHCEVVLGHAVGGLTLCGSASFMDGGVRVKAIHLDPVKWDVLDVQGDLNAARQWFADNNGRRYDARGIFGFVWSASRDSRGRLFCSEACAAALGLKGGERFSPGLLRQALIWRRDAR
jgi:hypothetical protein